MPRYINRYNKAREYQKIEREIEEEKAKHPPGTRLMPEEERLQTLEDLKASRLEVNNALEKLPVYARTVAIERHKRSLEEKLIRIDRAIETFQKSMVYI